MESGAWKCLSCLRPSPKRVNRSFCVDCMGDQGAFVAGNGGYIMCDVTCGHGDLVYWCALCEVSAGMASKRCLDCFCALCFCFLLSSHLLLTHGDFACAVEQASACRKCLMGGACTFCLLLPADAPACEPCEP